MPTIYERVAVCSDTTWNALSAGEQAEYDLHFNTWTGYLGSTKSDLVTINQGCREVIIWNDFGELPYFELTASQIGTHDANNYTIFRSHDTARNNGVIGSGLKMAGVEHNYTVNYVCFDGFEFNQGSDGTSGGNYFISCNSKYFYFENCLFVNIYSLYYSLNNGHYKNCLFYNFNVYLRNGSSCEFQNCGFYTVFTSTYAYISSNGIFYNCWAYTENRASGSIFASACTGDSNYATDGSGPIAPRNLSTFGFTDAVNGDFSITSGSPLFDSGVSTAAVLDTDIAGNPRIQGVIVDIGPFERVVQTIVTLEGLVIGSAVSIVDLDNGGFIVSPFVADATTETMEFSLSASTHVSVRVRNASGTPKYQPWSSDFLLTSAGATIYVNQVEDFIA